jgi:hypothetical protein
VSTYASIKDLVVQTYLTLGRFPEYDELAARVREHFPWSKWGPSHHAYYKSQIKTGRVAVPGLIGSVDLSGSESEDSSDPATAVDESLEAAVSLERDLQSYLITRVTEVEPGLTLVENGIEYQTGVGRIDLLARDSQSRAVVIELKAGRARDAALGQLLGYMGSLGDTEGEARGILVASSFDQRVIAAAHGLPNVKLIQYRVSFHLEEIP